MSDVKLLCAALIVLGSGTSRVCHRWIRLELKYADLRLVLRDVLKPVLDCSFNN